MTLISINVQNNSAITQNFFYFINPATTDSNCASLGTANLGNFAQTGAIVTFQLDFENMAGIQQAHGCPIVGQQSGFYSASQPISLSTGSGTVADATTMVLNPLGLTPPAPASGVRIGNFRIVTTTYDSKAVTYNAGTALRTSSGGVVLPNFFMASPNLSFDIQPSQLFAVAVGNYATGVVVLPGNLSAIGACDASVYTSFLVVYNAAGTFTVTSGVDPFLTTSNAAVVGGGQGQKTTPTVRQILVSL